MKKLIILLLIAASTQSQAQTAFSKKQTETLISKNFYLISALEKSPEIKKILPATENPNQDMAACLYTREQATRLNQTLEKTYDSNKTMIDRFLDKHIRPSGHYILFDSLSGKQLWLKCWNLYYRGINQIITVYGLGNKGRYPDIDSASYNTKSPDYQHQLKNIIAKTNQPENTPFYQAPLTVALELLKLNKRDEAARLEPLEKGENKHARHKAKNTDFSKYSYTAILVPGEGPEDNQPLSEGGKTRCELVAEAYKNQKAPFIILSGGNVHPFQTPYNEALEMKKYLIEKHHIPASAIIIDPHARHTTTNFRNAGRYLIGYGFPIEKPALCITDKEQADYIMDPRFNDRNNKELGYLPYKNLKRISETEIEFFTVKETQFRDPIDPLDP